MQKPCLIDDLKLDLRISVLFWCVNKMKAFIYKERIVRFTIEPPSTQLPQI